MKINKDFIKIFVHQIDNRPNYSFTSSQLCLLSVKWIFFIDQVFEIESCRLGRLLLDRWVGGSVVGRSVGRWVSGRWSVDLIKPEKNTMSWENIPASLTFGRAKDASSLACVRCGGNNQIINVSIAFSLSYSCITLLLSNVFLCFLLHCPGFWFLSF